MVTLKYAFLLQGRKTLRGTHTSGKILVLSVVQHRRNIYQLLFLSINRNYLSTSQANQTKKREISNYSRNNEHQNCSLFYANLIRKTFPCLFLPQISFLPSGKPSFYHSENTVKLFSHKSLQQKKNQTPKKTHQKNHHPTKKIAFKGKRTKAKHCFD